MKFILENLLKKIIQANKKSRINQAKTLLKLNSLPLEEGKISQNPP